MDTNRKIPKFMILPDRTFCSPVTIYIPRQDGTFFARCLAIPGFVVVGETYEEAIANVAFAYHSYCQCAIYN